MLSLPFRSSLLTILMPPFVNLHLSNGHSASLLAFSSVCFDRPCDLPCYGLLYVLRLSPVGRGATSSCRRLLPWETKRHSRRNMHTFLLIFLQSVKSLFIFVLTALSSSNAISTTAVVPLARINLHLPELRLGPCHSPG